MLNMPKWANILEAVTTGRTEPLMEKSSEVVPMRQKPVTYEQLRSQIANIQNAIVKTETERAQIERVREEMLAEIQAALDDNSSENEGLRQRLRDLQSLVVDMVRETGVRVEVPR